MSLRAISTLNRYGQQDVNEFDQNGLGGIESMLINQGGPRSLADISRISAGAGAMSDQAFTSAAGIASRQQRALGLTPSARESASMNRRMGLAKVLGNVDARNRALMADQQQREVIRTGSFGLRDIIDKQIYANLEGAANIEGGVARQAAANSAQNAQDQSQLFGQTAGMALSIFGGKK